MQRGSEPNTTQRTQQLVLALLCGFASHAAAQADIAQLPLEQLMQMEVRTASRYAQTALEAPAVVSVVTADDIRLFGYRTLAEVLGSMRGLYVSYDRSYHYLGTRGFATPGDYNTRVLLLVNGVGSALGPAVAGAAMGRFGPVARSASSAARPRKAPFAARCTRKPSPAS